MRNRIFSHTGILDIEQSILLDRDLLRGHPVGYNVVVFLPLTEIRRILREFFEVDIAEIRAHINSFSFNINEAAKVQKISGIFVKEEKTCNATALKFSTTSK